MLPFRRLCSIYRSCDLVLEEAESVPDREMMQVLRSALLPSALRVHLLSRFPGPDDTGPVRVALERPDSAARTTVVAQMLAALLAAVPGVRVKYHPLREDLRQQIRDCVRRMNCHAHDRLSTDAQGRLTAPRLSAPEPQLSVDVTILPEVVTFTVGRAGR